VSQGFLGTGTDTTAVSFARRVVVGVDFSESAIEAARWCARNLNGGAEVMLVHVLAVPEMPAFLGLVQLPPSLIANARAGAEQRLRELSLSLPSPRIWVEVREGRPSEAIAQVARDFGAELIAVGKHGVGGRARGYPGSTADQLVRMSPAPVMVASGLPDGAPKRLLVALTHSSVTDLVLEWTRRLSDRFDAKVHVVHVIGSAVLSHVLSMAAVTQGKEIMTEAEIDRVFTDERDGWARRLVETGVPAERVDAEVTFGDVSQEVLAAASREHAQLIIMGTHAGPIRRALLGSAASGVLRNATIPVLIVREPEDEIP
jgi:nucleotide-binding universal stress UspA family protein